ncbi:hypothetical protein [Azospirillum lipoferum]|uniref:hypothetical protein n=1 Tax=Azospirillum lipoferum TaxID=193 RepID=UPI001396095B|nr:hypothetical protein [Azospirillum lipoferum]
MPLAGARRVLDCDINFKKADSQSGLFAPAGLRQWSVCDMTRLFNGDGRFVERW